MANILIVEDEPAIAEAWKGYLKKVNHQAAHMAFGQEAMEYLARNEPDIVLLDLGLPDIDGALILEYLEKRQRLTQTAVIVTTGDDTITRAVNSMQKGAYDYLVKPFTRERLLTTIDNALKSQRLNKMVHIYREELDRQRLGRLIGTSLPMQLIYKTIEAAAPSKANIVIYGEAGTERAWVAETIHMLSRRHAGPFQQFNIRNTDPSNIGKMLFGQQDTLLEAEQKGRLPGLLGALQEGTLFIDELSHCPAAVQQSLYNYLQTGMYQPEGTGKIFQSHCRIIAGISEDPQKAIATGRLREELWHRLNAVPIHLLPLRERHEDIPLIASERLREKAIRLGKSCLGFTPEAELALMSYDWPHNMLELTNLVDQLAQDHNSVHIDLRMLPERFHHLTPVHQNNMPEKPNLARLELVWEQDKSLAKK